MGHLSTRRRSKMQSMTIFALLSLFLFNISLAKDEIPFSLDQLFEDNPDLMRLIEKRLGEGKQKDDDVDDENKIPQNSPGPAKIKDVNNEGIQNDEKHLDKSQGLFPHHDDSESEPTCVPTAIPSSIIRSNASLQNGAIFLQKSERISVAQCKNQCCYTQGCNLAVYENKEDHNCYLFNCGTPSKCKFAHSDDYVSFEYRSSGVSSHEDELDGLDIPPPVQKTPAPVPPTLAPTTQKVKVLPLYSACYWGDICTVVNSECIHGQCRCRDGYYEHDGTCIKGGCSQNMFECKIKGSSMCLPKNTLCNGVEDCDDGVDENNCPDQEASAKKDDKSSTNHQDITAQVLPVKSSTQNKAPVKSQNTGTSQMSKPQNIPKSKVQSSLFNFNNPSDVGYNNGESPAKENRQKLNQYWPGQQQYGPQTGNGYYNQGDYGNYGNSGTGSESYQRPQENQWGYTDYKAYPNGYDRNPVPSSNRGDNPLQQNSDSYYNGQMLNQGLGNSDDYYRDGNRFISLKAKPTPPTTATTTTTTTMTTPTTTTTKATTTTTVPPTTTTLKPTTLISRSHQRPSSQADVLSRNNDGFFPSWGKHVMENDRNRLNEYDNDNRIDNDNRNRFPGSGDDTVRKLDNIESIADSYRNGEAESSNLPKYDTNIHHHRKTGQREHLGHRNKSPPRKQYPYQSYNGYPNYDNSGFQGNYPPWSDYNGDYYYRDDNDYREQRPPVMKQAPKYDYDYHPRGSHVRNDKKPKIPNPVSHNTELTDHNPKMVEHIKPKITDIPKETLAPTTPSVTHRAQTNTPELPKTNHPPAPKPTNDIIGKSRNDSIAKQKVTEAKTGIKDTDKKTEKQKNTGNTLAKDVPDKGDNSISEEEASGKVIVASMTSDAQGPIVALSLGLAITLMLLIFVGCRLRTVKQRIRRGKSLHSNEADYLINGMYL